MKKNIEELKLDFSDVLIKPCKHTSYISSRQHVKLSRTFSFKYAKTTLNEIPIIAANMDNIGTFSMAKSLSEYNCSVALTKHYKIDELVSYINNTTNNFWYSLGIVDDDFEKLEKVVNLIDSTKLRFCLDDANGYSLYFLDAIKKLRTRFPEAIIMAGNVVTSDGAIDIVNAGADIVKIGIGSGCFIPGTLVRTEHGDEPIEKVTIGTKVLTHKGNWRRVTKRYENRGPIQIIHEKDDSLMTAVGPNHKTVVNVNGIRATPNHEFYVLHKKHKDLVTEENIHEYADQGGM